VNEIQPDAHDEFDWRWVFLLPAAVVAFILVQHTVFLLTAVPGLPSLALLAIWTLSDWVATVTAVYVAIKYAPGQHVIVAMLAAMILTAWHTIMLCAGHQHPISNDSSIETITVTAIGGIILTGAACTCAMMRVQSDASKKAALIRSLSQLKTTDEHPIEIEYKVSPSQSSHHADLDYAFPNPSGNSAATEKAEKIAEAKKDNIRAWYDSDMRLLEVELRVSNLEIDSYVSAIRLALAIEKAGGLKNCSGEHLYFNQICLDCCMRLSLVSDKSDQWRRFAHAFRRYGDLGAKDKTKLLTAIENSLPIPERQLIDAID